MSVKKKKRLVVSFRDARETMAQEEYEIWKRGWDSLGSMLVDGILRQIKADKDKGVKPTHAPKREIVTRCLELASRLGIEVPKSFGRLLYDDVLEIKAQLEYELKLQINESDVYEVVYDPPRTPSNEVITAMVQKARARRLTVHGRALERGAGSTRVK